MWYTIIFYLLTAYLSKIKPQRHKISTICQNFRGQCPRVRAFFHVWSRVGKFMLQIPISSSTVSTHIDCGFKPVWAHVAERVLTNASKLMSNPCTYWPKLAYQEHLSQGTSSSYIKYLNKWKEATNSFGIHPKQIKKNVRFYAIKDVLDNKFSTATTSFALSCPGTTPRSHWFKMKPWITDSGFTQIFRTCNARLGNRSPTKDGRFFKLCPLCEANGAAHLNNEASLNYIKIRSFVINYNTGAHDRRVLGHGWLPEHM